MSSYLACHDTLLNVSGIRQAEVLCGSNVAEEVSAVCGSDSTADSGSDVVVSGSDIRNERSEHVERRIVADTLLELHIRGYFVHSHVSGALDHDLYILSPCSLGEGAELDEFCYLTRIGSVVYTAGTERVTEADSYVEFAEYLEHVVVVLEEGVLIAGHHHPREEERTSAGNDVHFSLVTHESLNSAAVDTCVDSHEVHALLGVCANDLEEVLRCYLEEVLLKVADSVVHRNSTYHRGRLLNERLAEGIGLAVVAEVHDSLCTELDSHVNFIHFHVIVILIAGDTEVHVYLRSHAHTDTLGRDRLVVDIAGDSHNARSHALAEDFRVHVFLFGNYLHFGRDYALLSGFHLCAVFSHWFYFLSVFIVDSVYMRGRADRCPARGRA